MEHRLLIAFILFLLLTPTPTRAQESCALFCKPELKIEPTITVENLWHRPRTEIDGHVSEAGREGVFELIFALGVPTTIPRIGLTFEAIFIPFGSTSEHPFTGATADRISRNSIRDNGVEIEAELNFDLVSGDQTGGWLSSHLDLVDKFSPGDSPTAASVYTHKLNLELDTAVHPFSWLPQSRWARNLEVEMSIDYVATGLAKAGDILNGELFLDDASPWSVSLVLVIPLAPLNP
jgi:hypothetical protein